MCYKDECWSGGKDVLILTSVLDASNGQILVTLLIIWQRGFSRKPGRLYSRNGRCDKGKTPSCCWKQPRSFHLQQSHWLTELPRSQLWSVTCFRMDGRGLVPERCTPTPLPGTSCVLSKNSKGKRRRSVTMFLQVLNLIIKLVLCNHRRKKKKVSVKQSLHRPWEALRDSGGWGSQISRQSSHEGSKVVSPKHRPPLPPPTPKELFLVLFLLAR